MTRAPNACVPAKTPRPKCLSRPGVITLCVLCLIATGCAGWGANVRYDRALGVAVGGKVYASEAEWASEGWQAQSVVAQADAGQYGGTLSIGYGQFESYMVAVASWSVRVSVLRTWEDPIFADPNQTYIGLAGDATLILPIQLSAGIYRHVRGTTDRRDWLATIGVGAGF